MSLIIATLILICILLACCYLLLARSLFNKLLAGCYLTNIFIVVICFWGVVSGNSSYIDVALIYAVISPVATIITVRYLKGEE